VNDGWRVATTLMLNERTAIGRGWSQGGRTGEGEQTGIDFDLELLHLAEAVGRQDDPHVRAMIGESWVLAAVQNQAVKRVSAAMRSGDLPGPAAAILKAMAGATAIRAGEIDLEIAGSRAVAWPADDTAHWGLHRLTSHGIGGGTTEMQLNAIAERLLDLPRDPTNDRELPFSQLRHNTPHPQRK
jgi:alkylation response protein AidB-like acyl-CoA dehydrogenase